LKVTFTSRFAFMVRLQVVGVVLSHPEVQVTVVEAPVGVAVSVTGLPVGKIAPHVVEQAIPGGVLTTIPVPPPKLTIKLGPVGPVPVKQTTVAVI
jgi:hypothetical protein